MPDPGSDKFDVSFNHPHSIYKLIKYYALTVAWVSCRYHCW